MDAIYSERIAIMGKVVYVLVIKERESHAVV
jgi:hypothetical protein